MSSIVTHTPRFSMPEAEKIAEELFGICGIFRQLPSERDQNYHVQTKGQKEYVLKIANKTEEKEALEFQNQAMAHVHRHKDLFPGGMRVCPEVCTTRKGDMIEVVTGAAGDSHRAVCDVVQTARPFCAENGCHDIRD